MTNYGSLWKRHYNNKPLTLNGGDSDKSKGTGTPQQLHTLLEKRGYGVNMCCNKCGEIVMLDNGDVPNHCKHCGNPLIKTDDINYNFD